LRVILSATNVRGYLLKGVIRDPLEQPARPSSEDDIVGLPPIESRVLLSAAIVATNVRGYLLKGVIRDPLEQPARPSSEDDILGLPPIESRVILSAAIVATNVRGYLLKGVIRDPLEQQLVETELTSERRYLNIDVVSTSPSSVSFKLDWS